MGKEEAVDAPSFDVRRLIGRRFPGANGKSSDSSPLVENNDGVEILMNEESSPACYVVHSETNNFLSDDVGLVNRDDVEGDLRDAGDCMVVHGRIPPELDDVVTPKNTLTGIPPYATKLTWMKSGSSKLTKMEIQEHMSKTSLLNPVIGCQPFGHENLACHQPRGVSVY